MSVFENPNFFNFPSDLQLLNCIPPEIEILTCSSLLKRVNDDNNEIQICEFCGRYINFFIIQSLKFCSYECILGNFKTYPLEYNFCKNLILKHYKGNGIIKAFPQKKVQILTEDFWKEMLSTHYDSTSIRKAELFNEYNSNQYTIDSEIKSNKKKKS